MNPIILFAYYIGIFSCAMQGAEKGKDDYYPPIDRYVLNSFGGGLIRDCILAVHPWLFTREALSDLTLVIFVGCIYSYYLHGLRKEHKKFVDTIVLITDALGLGSFIAIGMNKAFTSTNNIMDIIICGYITAIGGGILASKDSLVKTFQNTKTIIYHILTMLCCCFYYLTKFEIGLVVFTTICILLININIFDICYSVFFPIIGYKPYIKMFVQGEVNFYCDLQIRKYHIKKARRKIHLPLILSKRYLVLRRIRQC